MSWIELLSIPEILLVTLNISNDLWWINDGAFQYTHIIDVSLVKHELGNSIHFIVLFINLQITFPHGWFEKLLSYAQKQRWFNEPNGERWTGQFGPFHLETYYAGGLDIVTRSVWIDILSSRLLFLHKFGGDKDCYGKDSGFHYESHEVRY